MCPRSLFVDTIKVPTKAIILTHTLGVHTVRTVRLPFKEVSKILSAFLGGIVLGKLGHLVDLLSTDKNLPFLFDRMVIRRVMIAVVCLLITMMVVFVSRQYFQVDEPSKGSK
jgi:hypothetical protein